MKGFFNDVKSTFKKPFTKKKNVVGVGKADQIEHFSSDDYGFGFKVIEKVETDQPHVTSLEKRDSNDEFCSIDASDLIRDKLKALVDDEWTDLMNRAVEDREVLFEPITRQRILKTIIKTGIPVEM